MPRTKEGKGKTKGTPLPIVPILQKFLKTYEKHCAQSQTSVCPIIRRDLKASIDSERILRKFILVRPDDSAPSILPVSLEPLLMTIRDERYTLGKELCIWGLQLNNPEVARLALLLELKGRTSYPFTTLEIVDCKMDLWSLGRLGKALPFSHLHSLVLDYCKFENEDMERVLSGLEKSQRLQGLSLRYCGLGPPSGPGLGSLLGQSALRELHLDGNYLQCSGALALLRPIAEHAEMQGKEQPATSSPAARNPPQPLPARQRGSSVLNQIRKSSGAVTVKSTSGKKEREQESGKKDKDLVQASRHATVMSSLKGRKGQNENFKAPQAWGESLATSICRKGEEEMAKQGIKKKSKGLPDAGPWLVKLHLADNGIDGKGKEGEKDLLEFIQILTCLIKYSTKLREIDLGNNVLGEMAAADILEALRARNTGELPGLKITVTPQISSDTFRSIWKNSRKSSITRKKKKKAKK